MVRVRRLPQIAGGEGGFEVWHVQGGAGREVHPDGITGDLQVWIQILAHAVDGGAQVGARLLLAAVRPDEFGQHITRNRALRAGQVDKQRGHGARGKVQFRVF
jgi:hypothetical protein